MTDVKHLVNMSIDIDVNSANSLEDEEFSELICETYIIDVMILAFVYSF